MKKVISIALALCLCLVCFVGCGEKTYDGWKKVEFGEVSYQVDKSWRAREDTTTSDNEKKMHYYVDDYISFNVVYGKVENTSENSDSDHDKAKKYYSIEEDDSFEELPERKVGGKQAYHCKKLSYRQTVLEYYAIGTPNGYVVFYADYYSAAESEELKNNFSKLLDSVKIVREKPQPEPKVEKSGEYKGWKTEQIAEITFKVPQEWENSPYSGLNARYYDFKEELDNVAIHIGLEKPEYHDKDHYVEYQQSQSDENGVLKEVFTVLEDTEIAGQTARHYTYKRNTATSERVISDVYVLDTPSGVFSISSVWNTQQDESPLKEEFDLIMKSITMEE